MSKSDPTDEPAGIEFVTPGPDAVEVVVQTARELAAEGKPEQAEVMLRSVLDNNPTHLGALLTLGGVLLERGNADEAIVVNEQASRVNPDLADPFVNLGYAFILKGDYDQAVCECEEAIFIDPSAPAPYANLSLAYLLKEDWDMCLRVAEKMLELDPTSGLAHNNAAVACFRKGAVGDAVRHLGRAVELGYPVEEGFLDEVREAVKAMAEGPVSGAEGSRTEEA